MEPKELPNGEDGRLGLWRIADGAPQSYAADLPAAGFVPHAGVPTDAEGRVAIIMPGKPWVVYKGPRAPFMASLAEACDREQRTLDGRWLGAAVPVVLLRGPALRMATVLRVTAERALAHGFALHLPDDAGDADDADAELAELQRRRRQMMSALRGSSVTVEAVPGRDHGHRRYLLSAETDRIAVIGRAKLRRSRREPEELEGTICLAPTRTGGNAVKGIPFWIDGEAVRDLSRTPFRGHIRAARRGH